MCTKAGLMYVVQQDVRTKKRKRFIVLILSGKWVNGHRLDVKSVNDGEGLGFKA